MSAIPIIAVERLDLRFVPRQWQFAQRRRAQIDDHFAEQRRQRPSLWNGKVLLARECAFEETTFRAAFFETDFASFLAWRDWGFPDKDVRNCFAMAAIRTADDAFLLGVMGPHTSNSGHIYFPSGTPDPEDVIGNRVDFERNIWREVAEETGLPCEAFTAEPGWHGVLDGPRIALMKVLRTPQRALEMRVRILDHLARETRPELTDIRIARGPADLDPAMPVFVTAFLAHMWK
jgi:hypothetical protein